MKYFLIGLFSLFFNLCSAQVTIPDPVAEFFLEKNEQAKALEKEVVNLKEKVNVLKDEIKNLSKQKDIDRADITNLEGQLGLAKEELKFKEDQYGVLKKEIRRQKIQKVIAFIVTGIVVTVTLLAKWQ